MEELDRIIQQIESGGITIQLRPEAGTRKIERFDQLKSFVEEEHAFWAQFINTKLIKLLDPLRKVKVYVDNAEKAFASGDANQAKANITQIARTLDSNVQCFSATPLASFFEEMYDAAPIMADAAYDYLITQQIDGSQLTKKKYLIGIAKSFLYENIFTSLDDKVKAEKDSLERIRSKYSEAIDSFDSFYHRTVNDVSSAASTFKTELTEWREATVKGLQEKLKATEQDFENLKKQYEEYMRLEGPAKYWDQLHKDYEKKGGLWRNWAIGASVVATGILMCILYNFPECLYMQGQSFSFTSLKGTIVLALIVSILVYLIRLFVKLSISSYHLSRDAKERYQLTHVYLSMIKDAAVDEKDRAIVLQSLFSRADTGLLKGDHSPAMPEGLVSQVIRGVR
jgi:uncharacterized coiled-coil DUF342 family protein